MATSGGQFPGQHTTTTTVTSTAVQTNIRFDLSYIRTIPGAIKCALILLNLLGFICIEIAIDSYSGRGSWFNTVAMGGFWFTGIMLVLYLFHVVEKFYRIPWLKVELVFCAIWTVFYLLAASLVVAWGSRDGSFIAAGLFGYCAMICYGYDAFLKFKAVKSGEIAQGERQIKQSSTVTSPAY